MTAPAGATCSEKAATRAWAARRLSAVLLQGVREGRRQRRRLHTGEVPRSPAEIDAGWLTAALCHDAPAAVVQSVALSDASVGTTTRAVLRLAYNDEEAASALPRRVFVKCTATLAQRLMLGLGGLIDGEPNFYMHVRPRLQIEAPIGYYGAVDARSWRSVVVIEDVASSQQATFWRPDIRLSESQIAGLLRNVAQWHGALWESPLLARWRWLRSPAEQMRLIDALLRFADRRQIGARRASAVIPIVLRNRQRDLYEAMRRAMALASEGPRTYLHGDLHVANTYLTAEDAVGVCDWQVGLAGSWAHDYAYLLISALPLDDRRAWERELLSLYLEHLAASGGPTIAFETAWQSYRQATFYPYFAWTYTIGRSMFQPKFQPDQTCLTMIERISAAIEDLDSLRAVGL